MSLVQQVCDQLLSRSIYSFIILSSSGDVLECSGDFKSPQKQKIAAAILHQIPYTLRMQNGEKYRRAVMALENIAYIATEFSNESESIGVVLKHPAPFSNDAAEEVHE